MLMPLFVVLIFSISAFGISVAEYRTKLAAAQSDVNALLAAVSETKLGNDGADQTAIVARLRGRLPAGQTVDISGGSVEADTGWLNAELDEFEALTNLSEKTGRLAGIKERLVSIDYRIEQLEKAAAAQRSKDEDKQKLAEILKRQEYQKPEPPKESLLERWYREFMEWLNKSFPRPDIAPVEGSGLSSLSFWLQVLLYGLLAAAILFALFRFVPFLSTRFGKGTRKKKRDRVILGEHIAADASAFDLFSEADDLARSGDLRLAIRKGYIALLCELSDRKLIGLARHKTNRDYLRDVRKRPQLFENMSGMTTTFERHWYGFKDIETGEWEDFRATYERAVNETSQS